MNLNEIIQYHFKSCIKEKHELPGCRKEGYILILDNGKKIVFRAQNDYHEIFLREKFFMTILIGSMIKYVRKFML